MHSWRTLILPYVGEQTLYDQYRFDEPWNSSKNLEVTRQMPEVFRCPNDWQAGPSDTSYSMIVGRGAFSEETTPSTLNDIQDGASRTIAVVETSGIGVRWTQPRDLNIEEMNFTINDRAALGINGNHLGGAEVQFADGQVLFVADYEMTFEDIRELMTRAGGERTIDEQ